MNKVDKFSVELNAFRVARIFPSGYTHVRMEIKGFFRDSRVDFSLFSLPPSPPQCPRMGV